VSESLRLFGRVKRSFDVEIFELLTLPDGISIKYYKQKGDSSEIASKQLIFL
jgi:hypothetical protein